MSFRDFAKSKYPSPHSHKVRSKPFDIRTDLKPGMRIVHRGSYQTVHGVFNGYGSYNGVEVIWILQDRGGRVTWSEPKCISLESSSEPWTTTAA